MLEQILEKATQFSDQAEVLEVQYQALPVEFENNKLKAASSKSVKGYALRIIREGKLGFASSTRPDAADQLVQFALETAQFGQNASFQMPANPAAVPHVQMLDPRITELSVERMVEMGAQILDHILSAEPDAQISVSVGTSHGMQRLINSKGLDVSFKSTRLSVGASVEILQGTDMLQTWEDISSRQVFDCSSIAQRILERVRLGKSIVPIETGSMPVIFTPKGLAATLLAPLTLGLNGKEAIQGATPVSEKLGERMFDEKLSIYDDATIDFATGSQPVDDEGTICRKLPLINKGVVSNFVYDLDTAAKAGKVSTGNGQRGLGSLPSPGYNNLVIEPGEVSLADMIKGIDHGLLIDQTMGSWTGNVRSGQISGNVHYGIKIEKGELVGRVKDAMVACNAFDALANIEALENQCHWKGSLLAPHILFGSLNIAARS